jgi:KDO2-lipid IV(A) lauroyltransferase
MAREEGLKQIIKENLSGYSNYLALRTFCFLAGVLNPETAHRVATRLGDLAYFLSREKKKVVKENLRRVLPGAGERELEEMTRKSFQNYARYWLDFLRCWHLTLEEIRSMVVPHGVEWIDRCLEGGKGVIFALPHFGSWDMLGGWVGLQYPRMWAVAEQLKPRALFDFHTELRRRMGIRIIPLGENTAEKVVQACLENGIVCLLSDRVVAGSGVEVEFFGEKVLFPVGPALLAVKLGTPILPCLTIREGGMYHGYVGPPLEVEITGDTRRDVQANMQKLAQVFEDFIRRDPTQWHMFQPIFDQGRSRKE